MSTQHQDTRGRPDRSRETLPTGAALLPALQVLALMCLALFGWQLVEASAFTVSALTRVETAALCCVLAVVGLIGAAWVIRRRLGPGRGRAACSVTVLILVTGPTMLGRVSFSMPVVIIATALLVVDIGVRASLAGDVVVSAVCLPLLCLALGHPWAETLSDVLSIMTLMLVGTVLGLVLSRYDAALAAQRRAIAERDAALENAQREAALEKELMLAQERARAAHELHDGLGHRLTQIGMSLEFAGRVRSYDPEVAWNEVAVAERTSREAVGEMRTWVRALSPVRAEDDCGVAGLEDVAASFRGTGVRVRVIDELSPRSLTEAAELLMYRTVQEGLTNALRHCRARSVDICVSAVARGALVTVTNDIPVELRPQVPRAPVGSEGGASAGFGLGGLSERAAELGGAITAGRDDDFFRLALTLPPREVVSLGRGAS